MGTPANMVSTVVIKYSRNPPQMFSRRSSCKIVPIKRPIKRFERTNAADQIEYTRNFAFIILVLDMGKDSKSFAVPSEYSLPKIQLETNPKTKTPPTPTAWVKTLK